MNSPSAIFLCIVVPVWAFVLLTWITSIAVREVGDRRRTRKATLAAQRRQRLQGGRNDRNY